MRYRVNIPESPYKRLKNKSLIIHVDSGWGFGYKDIYDVNNTEYFEFNVPDKCEYIDNNRLLDGPTFHVILECSNDIRSKIENIKLIPIKINIEI